MRTHSGLHVLTGVVFRDRAIQVQTLPREEAFAGPHRQPLSATGR